jgi:hypothetical protein
MPETINVTIDSTLPSDKKKSGALNVKVEDFASTPITGSQDVYLTDGFTNDSENPADWTDVKISKMGKNDNSPDTFNFDLSAFDDSFNVTIVSEGPEDSFIIDGATSYSVNSGFYTIQYLGSDGDMHTMTIDPGDANVIVNVVCFTPSTWLDTPDGALMVGSIKVGDMISTMDNGPQPVRFIGRRRVVFSERDHNLKPIRIRRGAYDGVHPRRDMMLSPQHRILLRGPAIKNAFGVEEVLGPVKGMLGQPGFRKALGRGSIEYVSILFDRHEIVYADGVPAESFLPRPYATAYLPPNTVSEINGLFPGVFSEKSAELYPPARNLVKVKEMNDNYIHAHSLAYT